MRPDQLPDDAAAARTISQLLIDNEEPEAARIVSIPTEIGFDLEVHLAEPKLVGAVTLSRIAKAVDGRIRNRAAGFFIVELAANGRITIEGEPVVEVQREATIDLLDLIGFAVVTGEIKRWQGRDDAK